jgi:hypothetical protein
VGSTDKRSSTGTKETANHKGRRAIEKAEKRKKEEAERRLREPATIQNLVVLENNVRRNFNGLSARTTQAAEASKSSWRALDIMKEFLVTKGIVEKTEFDAFFTTAWEERLKLEKAEFEAQQAAVQAKFVALEAAGKSLAEAQAELLRLGEAKASPDAIEAVKKTIEERQIQFKVIEADVRQAIQPPPLQPPR